MVVGEYEILGWCWVVQGWFNKVLVGWGGSEVNPFVV